MNSSTHLTLVLTIFGSLFLIAGDTQPLATVVGQVALLASAIVMLVYSSSPRLRLALMFRRCWVSIFLNVFTSAGFCALLSSPVSQTWLGLHLSLSVAVLIKTVVVYSSEPHCFIYRKRAYAIDI